jgi:hypothetical protein
MNGDQSMPPPVQAIRVIQDTPVVFADGVMSQSYIHGVSNFTYIGQTLVRTPPEAIQIFRSFKL